MAGCVKVIALVLHGACVCLCVLVCAVLCCADPLVMDNGQDLVTMCCHAYESPDGADEEEVELVDYCECCAVLCDGVPAAT